MVNSWPCRQSTDGSKLAIHYSFTDVTDRKSICREGRRPRCASKGRKSLYEVLELVQLSQIHHRLQKRTNVFSAVSFLATNHMYTSLTTFKWVPSRPRICFWVYLLRQSQTAIGFIWTSPIIRRSATTMILRNKVTCSGHTEAPGYKI